MSLNMSFLRSKRHLLALGVVVLFSLVSVIELWSQEAPAAAGGGEEVIEPTTLMDISNASK